jgi:hypothetical protein
VASEAKVRENGKPRKPGTTAQGIVPLKQDRSRERKLFVEPDGSNLPSAEKFSGRTAQKRVATLCLEASASCRSMDHCNTESVKKAGSKDAGPVKCRIVAPGR